MLHCIHHVQSVQYVLHDYRKSRQVDNLSYDLEVLKTTLLIATDRHNELINHSHLAYRNIQDIIAEVKAKLETQF